MWEDELDESFESRVPSLSLATLLLFVVVVAVVTSVAARVPEWPLHHWFQLVAQGLTAGAAGVACVWIVYGRGPWWLRLPAIPILLFGFASTLFVLGEIIRVLRDWANNVYKPLNQYWNAASNSASWGMSFWLRVVGIGMLAMVTWLMLVRRAGLFDPFRESAEAPIGTREVDRGTRAARVAAVAVFIIIASLPLAVLYRLALPPAIPTLTLPEPNGWDDLLAAGEMIGPELQASLSQWIGTNQPLPNALYRPEAVALMRRGLARESVNPYIYGKWPKAVSRKFSQAYGAASAYAAAAALSKDLNKQLDAYWDYLRFTNASGLSVGPPGQIEQGSFQWESSALQDYWSLRTQLSQKQCEELLAKLVDYDKHRDTWENKVARQRIVDANADWETRLNVILADWSGSDPYWNGYEPYNPILRLRFLMTELAIRAYRLKYQKLPDSIQAVVPEFLPAIPQDPFSGGPILYRRVGESFAVYSVGPDGDDDGGRVVTRSSSDGDYTCDLMFQ